MDKPVYQFKKQGSDKCQKKPPLRSLRQLVNAECQYRWPEGTVLYHQIEAPPSLRPGIKVSDLSGLPSNLQEPSTKLRYANADEYRVIKDLPADTVKGYLLLRNAHSNTML
ncbi:unnamed protein product [Mesocestoides corti]|uniref:YL1_C domain-containing protein n=1 Tax=Mesocestoides corti TaxID=53468 RepID=A0A0R3UPW6_MESCO|nr:unnamed protein product [Mesocestoides corti]